MASSSPGGNYHYYNDPTSIPEPNDESNQDQSGLYEQRETDSDDESSITLTSSDNSYSDSDNDEGDEFERFAAYKGWNDSVLICFQFWCAAKLFHYESTFLSELSCYLDQNSIDLIVSDTESRGDLWSKSKRQRFSAD